MYKMSIKFRVGVRLLSQWTCSIEEKRVKYVLVCHHCNCNLEYVDYYLFVFLCVCQQNIEVLNILDFNNERKRMSVR